VNRGVYRFEPVDDKTVRYGLGAVKGTGQGAIEAIVPRAKAPTARAAGPSAACSTSAPASTSSGEQARRSKR
jgi:DNA polymerase-3 subunit alpha